MMSRSMETSMRMVTLEPMGRPHLGLEQGVPGQQAGAMAAAAPRMLQAVHRPEAAAVRAESGPLAFTMETAVVERVTALVAAAEWETGPAAQVPLEPAAREGLVATAAAMADAAATAAGCTGSALWSPSLPDQVVAVVCPTQTTIPTVLAAAVAAAVASSRSPWMERSVWQATSRPRAVQVALPGAAAAVAEAAGAFFLKPSPLTSRVV